MLELLQKALDEAPFSVAITRGEDFVFVYANATYRAFAPERTRDLIGRRAFDVFPESENKYRPVMERVLRTGEPAELEDSRTTITGEERFLTQTIRRLQGDPPLLLIYASETTAMVRAKREREILQRHLETVLDQVPCGVVLAEAPDGRIVFVNRRGREIVEGRTPPEATMEHYTTVATTRIDGKPYALEEYPLVRALKHGETVLGERMWIADSNEQKRLLRVNASPMRDEHGETLGAIAIFDDITGLQEQEDELRRAARARDQFLAMVSHELRAPLAALLLWESILRSPRSDEETRKRAIEAIRETAVHQSRLIEDLLDVSRGLSGKLRIERVRVELEPLIRSAVDQMLPVAAAKNVGIEVEIEPALGSTIGDSNRLRQVLSNLLSNAIKFTEEGGRVTVRARTQGCRAEIAVADTGQGIVPDLLPHIFEPFTQAGSELRPAGGLGLGLTIARHLVELHEGTLSAESPGEGRGATFTVSLPRARPDREAFTPAPAAPKAPSLAGVRVLVIDDEEPARSAVAELLRLGGAEAETAESAAQGRKRLAGGCYDVIICDIGMPGEDGCTFMTRARAAGVRVPAIALTAHVRLEDRARAIESGFDHHLPKPVDPDRLIETIAKLARRG